MSVNLSPFGPRPQFADWLTGYIASGYQLFFYAAGSTTKQNTYTNSVGNVANANPIILNTAGESSTGIYFTSGQTYKAVLATPTDTDPPANGYVLGDNLVGINDVAALGQDEWLPPSLTPTFVSATSFTLAGDQTIEYQANRRIKAAVTAGTSYATIVSSVFGAVTTVTVTTTGSNALDSGMSSVALAVMRAINTSWPQLAIAGTGVSISWSNGKPTISSAAVTLGTPIVTTSGTNIDFTIPAGVKRITVNFVGVSTNGTTNYLVQIGDSGGIEAAGYLGAGVATPNGSAIITVNYTAGFGVPSGAAANVIHGSIFLSLENSSAATWVASGALSLSNAATGFSISGSKSLSAGPLTSVRVTTTGSDNFDAGEINVSWDI